MKFQIDKDTFSEHLTIASRFTSSKLTSVSNIQGVLLKGEKDSLYFYSTNLTTFYKATIPMQDIEPFQVVIEPKKMLEFLAFLAPGVLEVEVKEKQVTVKMQKTKGNFQLILADDFPFPPGFPEKSQPMEPDTFIKELPLVLFSASNDDTRPVLTGVKFHNADNELLLVSTDGFRLTVIKDKKIGEFPSMIVPADFLSEVLRYMKESKKVAFNYAESEKMVLFEVDHHAFYSRLIEGDYPPFERVIPSEVKTTVVADKSELQRSIKLISVFARDFSNVCVVEVNAEGITLRPKKEGNSENTAFMEAEFTGEPMSIAFNFKFLLDVLNQLSSKTVTIELLRTDAPAVFKSDEHKGFMHVIMPVRIQE